MKKLLIRSVVWMLILLLFLSGLVACGRKKVPEQEDIFSKTIHDFEGFRVAQLGEEEDQNFLVYAQDTQQIQVSQESNRMISVDQETMVYTFTNPDEQLLSMEPGTVFFAEASPENPMGIAVKVKEIQVSGNTATVYSDPVGMEDLFEYVDIDMDMSLADVYYDESQLEEGMEIQVLSRDSAVVAGIVSTESVTEGETDTAGSVTTEVQCKSSGFQWENSDNTTRILMSIEHNVELGVAAKGNLHYQYKNQLLMRSIHVQFRYDKATNFFHTNVGYIVDTLWDASLAFEGNWSNGREGMGQTWPAISFFIPNTPIQVGVETFLRTELNGSMKGRLSQTESFQMGSSSTYYEMFKVAENNVCEPIGKTGDAKLELEGSVEVAYGVRADIGIPFVVDVFAEGSLGVRATGNLAMLGDKVDEDSIHDCNHCVDGDIEAFAMLDVGVDARIVTTITGKDLVYSWNVAERTVKVGDFYASYRKEVDGGVECGFGPCPHLRWKVIVTVKTQEDEPAEYAYVNAKYPDGRTDKKMTDKQGVAVFYLPNGDNTLNCIYQGEKGNGHAYVEDGPTTAKLKLEDKQQLFVCYCFWKGDVNYSYSSSSNFDFSEVYNILQMNYPDAVYIRSDEWNSHIQGIPQSFSGIIKGNYTSAGLNEVYGVAEGDVILFVEASSDEISGGYYNLHTWVSVFLLPEMKEAGYESQVDAEGDILEENVSHTIAVYQGNFYVEAGNHTLDENSGEYYLVDAYYQNNESIWQGLQIDENYRIQDEGTEWISTEWRDPAPGAGMLADTFFHNFSIHHNNLANYIFRAFPYIDSLMNGEGKVGDEVQP